MAGDTLDDLLADGPLDPGRGAGIIAQGAEALAIAHAAGVTHLCLTPRSLRWTADGGVKIVGLGLDAVLAGVTADDQALVDARAWAGSSMPRSRPAGRAGDGHPCGPPRK